MTSTMRQSMRSRHRAIAAFAFTGSALLILFWSFSFAGLLTFGGSDALVSAYENAFPFADAMLAATLFVAGIGLWRGRRYGRFGLSCGASMALYLGALDLTFYSRQGTYRSLTSEGAGELIVNMLCIVGGLAGLVFSWNLGRKRHEPVADQIHRVSRRFATLPLE